MVLGASMGNPTRGKSHEEGGLTKRKGGASGPPPPPTDFLEYLPPEPKSICFTILSLSPTPLTLTGGYPPPPFSGKSQLRTPANSLLHIKGVSQLKPLW